MRELWSEGRAVDPLPGPMSSLLPAFTSWLSGQPEPHHASRLCCAALSLDVVEVVQGLVGPGRRQQTQTRSGDDSAAISQQCCDGAEARSIKHRAVDQSTVKRPRALCFAVLSGDPAGGAHSAPGGSALTATGSLMEPRAAAESSHVQKYGGRRGKGHVLSPLNTP
ncbi:hypothetical protein EYF80_031320 [Liparis tanakae]|uniref:Uncharacterized protein n=1 Tax=Liparis tanakae TaxID=230148 RepID=A0A4Z2GXY7_9TELE|nr:hypothetical protein EYF80_031320 [Liparis tanakae]